MGDPLAGMIPYDAIGLYEQPKPMFRFKMPRVVPEQKSKFESDELFRKLSREGEVVLTKPNQNFTFRYVTDQLFIDGAGHCSIAFTENVNDETKDHLIPTNWRQ